MDEIKEGSRVVFREEILPKMLVKFARRIERREGIVERIWQFQGGSTNHYLVRWLKLGNRGKEFTERHFLGDLRLAQQSEATSAATDIASITNN